MTLSRFAAGLLIAALLFALFAHLLGLARAAGVYDRYEAARQLDDLVKFHPFITSREISADGSYLRVTFTIDNWFALPSGPPRAIYDRESGQMLGFTNDSGDDPAWERRWGSIDWGAGEDSDH